MEKSLAAMSSNTGKNVVHSFLVIFGLIIAYVVGGLIFSYNVNYQIFFGLSFALLFFALAQSVYELGISKAIGFLVVTAAIGFGVEVLGTNTGYVFGGKYTYGDFLGTKVLGVPIVVPLVWFIITFIGFSLTFSKFAGKRVDQISAKSLVYPIALASFGAMAWDLLVDPMFTHYGYWTWESSSSSSTPNLSGVPILNFVGWFVVCFAMISLFVGIFFFARKGPHLESYMRRTNTLDSQATYALLIIDGAVANFTLGNYLAIVVGVIAMSAFLLTTWTLQNNNNKKKEYINAVQK